MTRSEFYQGFKIGFEPNYISQGDEEKLFQAAHRSKIPITLKGPTGCGKTRFIEFMAHRLELPLVTVSCHEDLTAADLVGRFHFKDDQTVWQDGPLTLAVRFGGICYLFKGNMCFGIYKDFLIVRAGPDVAEKELKKKRVHAFDITGKALKGWIMVEEAACKSSRALRSYLELGRDYAKSLPPK